MTTISLALTVELDNVPPRVRIDVTDTGTPAFDSVWVTRTDSAGNTARVRTDTGEALQLFDDGTQRTGTVYDYEAPFGVPITYATEQRPTSSVTEPIMVDEPRIWLIHPGSPSKSRPIELMRGSLDSMKRGVEAGVFYPLGRRNAVIVSDGRRKGPQSELIVGTETPSELADLYMLLDDAFPLLLNVPPNTGLGVETAYIFINDVDEQRRTDIGGDPARNVSLPFQVVDMPIGGSQSQRTWQDVLDENATWQDVLNNYATWGDLLAPTT